MPNELPPPPPPSDATLVVSRGAIPTAGDQVMARLIEVTAGQYRIERELGRGGMAAVYLGHDLSLDRQVAIKVMSPELFNSGSEMVSRFLREARTGARLNHPHIIPVYAVREEQDLIFFVMKFIDGKALDAVGKAAGPLPVPVVARLIAQSADALAYAHRNGIIHRDIKPSNLMLDKEGWVIVTDLGIAKVQDSSALTATGSAIGTPTYMSPEQSMGSRGTSAAADQYSLGCVAYELLTGAPPFQGDSVVSLIYQHHADPPPPIHPVRPDAPAEMVDAIMKMLEKSPDDRFADMEEVAKIFRALSETDEDWLRLLLRGYAAGVTLGSGSAPSAGTQVRTPTPARRAATQVNPRSTPASMPPVGSPPGAATTARPATRTSAPAALAAKTAERAETPPLWQRIMYTPGTYGDPPTLRRPGWRSLALGSLVVWLGCFPAIGGLASTTPGVTALMQVREAEADAAVRRNQAPAKNGPCAGIRNALATCRTFTPVPLAEIAPVMQEAVLIGQDPAFRARGGIDWVALRHALGYPRDAFDVWNGIDRSDLFTVLPSFRQKMPRVGRSGSLHQQVVQNLWFPADDGVFRKLRELLATRRLATAIPPERTLELYLNTAEFGPGLYGVEAAAKAYFNVSAKALTDVQAATLAATLATPRTSTPIKDPEAMRARQALILRRLKGEAVELPSADAAEAATR